MQTQHSAFSKSSVETLSLAPHLEHHSFVPRMTFTRSQACSNFFIIMNLPQYGQ